MSHQAPGSTEHTPIQPQAESSADPLLSPLPDREHFELPLSHGLILSVRFSTRSITASVRSRSWASQTIAYAAAALIEPLDHVCRLDLRTPDDLCLWLDGAAFALGSMANAGKLIPAFEARGLRVVREGMPS